MPPDTPKTVNAQGLPSPSRFFGQMKDHAHLWLCARGVQSYPRDEAHHPRSHPRYDAIAGDPPSSTEGQHWS